MTNINYLVFIWNVFVDTLLLLIVYAWKIYAMQTLHAGGIPMFRGTYLVWNVFVDTLLLLIVYTWKMYDMQTLHAGGIPMFRGTYLVNAVFGVWT